MSNKQTATKNEKSNGSSGKNAQGSAHQITAATNELAAKNQKDASKYKDGNKEQSTLKTNDVSLDSKNSKKEIFKNHSSEK